MRQLSSISFLASFVVHASSVEFVPGAICHGVNHEANSFEVLRGRHLVALDTSFVPFGIKDESAQYGWRGFDVDLLSQVASFLDFTFEIREAKPLPGEAWTDMLLRTVDQADLWLSWWIRDAVRMNQTSMLSGHVDVSPVLVVPPPAISESDDLSKTLTTFFDPFSGELWICLVLLLLVSGVVDYLLERGHGGTVLSSLYEYFGGVLWGGFQDPHTRLSSVYQIVVAFVLLIVVSAYTANLASAMTISRTPQLAFGSIADVMKAKAAACTVGTYASQATYETLYQQLRFDQSFPSASAIDDKLLSGACRASIVPRVDYDTWLTKGANCNLALAGGSLYFSAAGWVSNFNSSRCVQRSIEYALHHLQSIGKLSELNARWLPAASCDAVETKSGGRRLHESTDEGATRRRLSKAGGAGGASAASSSSSSPEEDFTMHIREFFGIFVLWGAVTVAVLAIKAFSVLYHSRTRKPEDSLSKPAESIKDIVSGTLDTVFGDSDAASAEYPADLDINNPSAMLRFLVRRTTTMHHELSQLKMQTPAPETRAMGDDSSEAIPLRKLTSQAPQYRLPVKPLSSKAEQQLPTTLRL